ncbi:MAG: hypothetical protein D6707_00760 [Bacteroidetes bacterium]|nr:MAG: hypothetical protein D6707_00760 [Bacteroidota bacterium]
MEIVDRAFVLSVKKLTGNRQLFVTYTEKEGKKTFIYFRRKTQKKIVQPFHLLEITYKPSVKKEILTLQKIAWQNALSTIFFHPEKSMQAVFLSEILTQTIIPESNAELFYFLEQSTLYLSENEDNKFYIDFLIFFTKYLGINIYSHPLEDYPPSFVQYVKSLSTYQVQKINRTRKKTYLDCLLRYYQEQTGMDLKIKSLPVIQAFFEGY